MSIDFATFMQIFKQKIKIIIEPACKSEYEWVIRLYFRSSESNELLAVKEIPMEMWLGTHLQDIITATVADIEKEGKSR